MQQFLLATVIDPIHYLDLEEKFVHLTQASKQSRKAWEAQTFFPRRL